MANCSQNVRLFPTRRVYNEASTSNGKDKWELIINVIRQNLLDYKKSSFAAREKDVFIVSFPKCGSTWTQQIVKLICNHGREDGMDLDEAIPWLEVMSPEEANAVPFPRIFECHTSYERIPGGEPAKTAAKYINVYRNPKDVAVSAYNYKKAFVSPEMCWDEFFEEFVSGKTFFPAIEKCVDHFLEWWKHRDSENILVLSFEWMKANHAEAVATIAKFIGYELTPATITEIVDQTTFEYMKTNPAANRSWMDPYGQMSGAAFMRKGKVGDWKNYFSDEQSARMDEEIRRAVDGTGLAFDYS